MHLLENCGILNGSEVFHFLLFRPPAVGLKYLKNNLLSRFLNLKTRDQAGSIEPVPISTLILN